MPRHVQLVLQLLLAVLAGTSGCAGLRDCSQRHTFKHQAKRAWRDTCAKNYCGPCPRDYKDGWQTGYYDVARGESGCVPAVPPQKYWDCKYQTPAGKQSVCTWFDGYRDGAEAARAMCACYCATIPASSTAVLPDRLACLEPTTCQPACPCGPTARAGAAGPPVMYPETYELPAESAPPTPQVAPPNAAPDAGGAESIHPGDSVQPAAPLVEPQSQTQSAAVPSLAATTTGPPTPPASLAAQSTAGKSHGIVALPPVVETPIAVAPQPIVPPQTDATPQAVSPALACPTTSDLHRVKASTSRPEPPAVVAALTPQAPRTEVAVVKQETVTEHKLNVAATEQAPQLVEDRVAPDSEIPGMSLQAAAAPVLEPAPVEAAVQEPASRPVRPVLGPSLVGVDDLSALAQLTVVPVAVRPANQVTAAPSTAEPARRKLAPGQLLQALAAAMRAEFRATEPENAAQPEPAEPTLAPEWTGNAMAVDTVDGATQLRVFPSEAKASDPLAAIESPRKVAEPREPSLLRVLAEERVEVIAETPAAAGLADLRIVLDESAIAADAEEASPASQAQPVIRMATRPGDTHIQ